VLEVQLHHLQYHRTRSCRVTGFHALRVAVVTDKLRTKHRTQGTQRLSSLTVISNKPRRRWLAQPREERGCSSRLSGSKGVTPRDAHGSTRGSFQVNPYLLWVVTRGNGLESAQLRVVHVRIVGKDASMAFDRSKNRAKRFSGWRDIEVRRFVGSSVATI